MKVLLNYCKIASVLMVVVLMLMVINHFHALWHLEYEFDKFQVYPITALTLLMSSANLIFWGLLLKNTNKKSPIRIPAIIGMISFILAICADILSCAHCIYFMQNSFLMMIVQTGIATAFIWLSRFFGDKVLKGLTIAIGIIVAILVFRDLLFFLGSYNFYEVLTYFIWAEALIMGLFFFFFAKQS